MPLDHSRLTVYREALGLLAIVDEIAERMPAGTSKLRDQLDRATTSIIANIAEGAGEFSTSEKKRFYRIARRSVNEVAAWLDILAQRKQISGELYAKADAVMTSIVSMLVTMAR